MKLRPYQHELKDAIRDHFRKGRKKVILCSPTGSGKTVTFASIAQDAVQLGSKVLIVVDRKELLEQAVDKLKEYGLNSVIITGGKRPRYNGKAFVATVQTLLKRELPDVNLIIIDEAHKQTFDKLLARPEYEKVFVIGATATPLRTGKMNQLQDYYDELVEAVTINELIEENFLCPARTFSAKNAPDVKGMKKRNGDFDPSAMFQVYDKQPLYDGVVDQYMKFAKGTKAICFNINVEHSKKTAETFQRAGIRAVHIDGSDTKSRRESTLFDFKRGLIDVLCNCDLFTTGFDEPSIETVIVNRATQSLPLWLQMCGRGSRRFGEKDHFKIIDMGGNVFRLGFWEQERPYSLVHKVREKEQPAPVKECPGDKQDKKNKTGCWSIIHASIMVCPHCGFEFEKKAKDPVRVEFAEILKKTIDTLPERLKGDLSTKTIAELEQIRKIRKYSIGWLVNQVARRSDLSLDELAAFKGYKRQWVDVTRDRLGLNKTELTQ